MQIFILGYTFGDGFTYSCDTAIPVKAESIEYIAVVLEEQLQAAIDLYNKDYRLFETTYPCGEILFGGVTLQIRDFMYNSESSKTYELYMPDIYTLEEWYDTLKTYDC